MSEVKSPEYEQGVRAALDPDADKRCPYVTETKEAEEWWLGFFDTVARKKSDRPIMGTNLPKSGDVE